MSFVQMTATTLSAIKGWPSQSAVDFTAKVDSTVTGVTLPGTVFHLSSTGTFLLGVPNSNAMPMFAIQGSADADVLNDGGDPLTQSGVWVAISPSGNLTCLVANGAYELVTTTYNNTQEYPPNTFLTSPTTGGTAGMLTPGVLGTNCCCGIVSRGVVDNGYGTDALAFWPGCYPVL